MALLMKLKRAYKISVFSGGLQGVMTAQEPRCSAAGWTNWAEAKIGPLENRF